MRLPAPAWVGLVALLPVLLAPSLASARETIGIALCSADGSIRTVQLPVGNRFPGERDDDHCAKACHAAASRKKATVRIS